MSAASADRGSVLGTSMASMRFIGLAASSSCLTARLQNDATAARLRFRGDGACPAISPRNARTGAAVSPAHYQAPPSGSFQSDLDVRASFFERFDDAVP